MLNPVLNSPVTAFKYTAAHQVFEKLRDMAWQRMGPQALAVAVLHLLSNVQEYLM